MRVCVFIGIVIIIIRDCCSRAQAFALLAFNVGASSSFITSEEQLSLIFALDTLRVL